MATLADGYDPTARSGYTSAQIAQHIKEAGIASDPMAMFQHAKKYGVSGSEVDAAMGWEAGTSDSWIKGNVLQPGQTFASLIDAGKQRRAAQSTTTAQPAQQAQGALSGVRPAQQAWQALPSASAYTGGALPAATDPTRFDGAALAARAGPMASATTYAPTEDALVSRQLTQLLSGNGAYVQRARAKANEYAAGRGLLNSSIAAGAGEAAAIDAALPVAQADATAHLTAQRDNAAASNQFSLDANRFVREGALSAAKASYDLGAQDRQFAFQASEGAADRGLRAQQIADDTRLREGALAMQREELGLRGRQLTDDTRIREGGLAVQQGQLGIQQGELDLRAAQRGDQAQQQQVTTYGQMQEMYLRARMDLETNPNLDGAAKANAINAMSDWFNTNFLAPVRAMYGNPESWPDFGPATPGGTAGGGSGGGAPWVPGQVGAGGSAGPAAGGGATDPVIGGDEPWRNESAGS